MHLLLLGHVHPGKSEGDPVKRLHVKEKRVKVDFALYSKTRHWVVRVAVLFAGGSRLLLSSA